jgi:acyl-CoA dehydrogenase
MDFALSNEQKLIIETVRRFIREELKPLEESVEKNGALDDDIARQIQKKSLDLGLYALNMPDRFGGAGLTNVERMLCEEQFGHTTDILIRRAFGNVYEPLLACRDAQIARWLEPTVRGERTCSIAITEPGAGSDARGIRTTARKTESGWILNGSKHFISDGVWSDFFIVSALTGEKSMSIFLVDKGLPGFTIGNDQEMMGLRGTPHVELFFQDVPLEPIALLGEQDKGFEMAMDMLRAVRLAQVAARAVGKACHVLALMAEHGNNRRQFGQPIGQFQLVQAMLADSATEINAARLMVMHAAWLLDQGQESRHHIAMVKVYASEMLGRVVDRAVQVFGGMGFCKELPIERYYRDARVYRIFDGTSEIHRIVVGRGVLKYGASLYELIM